MILFPDKEDLHMRRQLPNDKRPFRIFRDTEQELAREQARLRLNRQDTRAEDSQRYNKPLPPVDTTYPMPVPPVPNEPGPDAGHIPEQLDPGVSVSPHNGFSAPDWPFTQDETDPEQMKLETPAGMAVFGELATAYVPWQTFSQTLDPREALRVGTLFPELIRTPPLYQRPGS
jgi:hypothetical protein